MRCSLHSGLELCLLLAGDLMTARCLPAAKFAHLRLPLARGQLGCTKWHLRCDRHARGRCYRRLVQVRPGQGAEEWLGGEMLHRQALCIGDFELRSANRGATGLGATCSATNGAPCESVGFWACHSSTHLKCCVFVDLGSVRCCTCDPAVVLLTAVVLLDVAVPCGASVNQTAVGHSSSSSPTIPPPPSLITPCRWPWPHPAVSSTW
jgi:hypothetical protein